MATEQNQIPQDKDPNQPSPTGATEQQDDIQPIDRNALDPKVQAYLQALDNQLRVYDRTNKELSQRVASIDTRLQERDDALDPEEEKKRFYENPLGLIRQEIRQAINPLLEEAKQIRSYNEKVNRLSEYKNRVKNNPAVAQYWDAEVERNVDQILNSGNVELNDDTVLAATVQAVGMRALSGGFKQQPQLDNAVTPPHVRVTNPSPPKQQQQQQERRPLTEHERFMMRLNGFKTEEEYLQWLEMPSSEITTTKIGVVETK